MEELQDAIEDAQYVNAISNVDDGPRPVLPWEIPTEEQLAEWRDAAAAKKRRPGDPDPFGFDWTLEQALGFFLFSAYLKETCRDYVQINFVEEVLRFKEARGGARRDSVRRIVKNYLLPLADKAAGGAPATATPAGAEAAAAGGEAAEQSPEGEAAGGEGGDTSAAPAPAAPAPQLPEKTEIDEYDLARPPPKEEVVTKEVTEASTDSTCSRCCVGLTGPILDEILEIATVPVDKSAAGTPAKTPAPGSASEPSSPSEAVNDTTAATNGPASAPSTIDPLVKRRVSETKIQRLPDNFFDKAEAVVLASMKGTSGKLYAKKVMNKKRIKIKKSETLILNERRALSKVDSPFIVNLKYCFNSKDDVFLVLDLMTGGDLSFHLQQRGRFPKKEAMYYAARIMLGLQALHDHNYVYRDLKPENCLLAEDGRVKLTDLGLATEVYPKLHGAAGTRGYWAPEMLRRDKRGKRMPYGLSVDWFSFGCCVAEFISGTNPYRSEMALNFGLERGKKKKEEAIDCATLEMEPVLDPKKFDEDAADLCRKLLDKDEKTRLGVKGCKDIMDHPWFKDLNWESIITDRKKPPYVPPKDVNAASQSEIGTFAEDKTFQETVLEDKDDDHYNDWDWTNPRAFAAEVIEFLIYERETGQPLLPMTGGGGCCCAIM